MTNSDHSERDKDHPVQSSKKEIRQAREAKALRENLKKRKQQIKDRESAMKRD